MIFTLVSFTEDDHVFVLQREGQSPLALSFEPGANVDRVNTEICCIENLEKFPVKKVVQLLMHRSVSAVSKIRYLAPIEHISHYGEADTGFLPMLFEQDKLRTSPRFELETLQAVERRNLINGDIQKVFPFPLVDRPFAPHHHSNIAVYNDLKICKT